MGPKEQNFIWSKTNVPILSVLEEKACKAGFSS